MIRWTLKSSSPTASPLDERRTYSRTLVYPLLALVHRYSVSYCPPQRVWREQSRGQRRVAWYCGCVYFCGSTFWSSYGSLPRFERLRRPLRRDLPLVLFVLLNLDLAPARRFTKALRPSRPTQTTLTQDPRTIYKQYDPSHPCSCPRLFVFPMLRLRHSPYHHPHFTTSSSQPSSPSSTCSC